MTVSIEGERALLRQAASDLAATAPERAPISVCLIVKNEAANLRECLLSLRPYVAEIVVVDTGSTDDTLAIAHAVADRVESFAWVDDFSAARTFAFSLATHPWVMWVDGDDVVEGAEHLPALCREYDVTRAGKPCEIALEYEYARDADGYPAVVHRRERLVTPCEAFEWREPVHEVLVPHEPGSAVQVFDPRVRVVHRRTDAKPREPGRNLRILEAHVAKGTPSGRTLFYLGRELLAAGRLIEAADRLGAALDAGDLPEDDAALACIDLAKAYTLRGNHRAAALAALRALTFKETWPQPWLAAGRAYYRIAESTKHPRDWERAVYFLRRGIEAPPAKTMLWIDPQEQTFDAHRYLNVALQRLGRVAEAHESCLAGLRVRPDETLEANRKLYANYLAREQIGDALDVLRRNERLADGAIRSMLTVLDAPFEPEAPAALPAGKLDVVFYTGPALERWTPRTAAERGIGGSETAVIEMAKRIAAQGHRVRVYGDCLYAEGDYDGVSYVHHTNFRGVRCDVLIASRRADAIDGDLCTARAKFVWVHDVHLGPALTHARAIRTDRFLVLSQWHRDNVLAAHPEIHPSQVIVTRNGIDLSRFAKSVPRNPHRVIYSSSPDRGLDALLDVWPRVRSAVPDATLDVYYGFDGWAAVDRDAAERCLRRLERMHADGVTYHGRVDQATLAEAMLGAGVWAYPTWFHETSCIGAIEAQAAGLHIVTTPLAALPETCPHATFVDAPWMSEAYQGAFVRAVVMACASSVRATFARHSWDAIAAEWLEMFPRVIAEVERDVMPKYQEAAQ